MQNLGAKNEVFIGGLPLNTTTGKKERLLVINLFRGGKDLPY